MIIKKKRNRLLYEKKISREEKEKPKLIKLEKNWFRSTVALMPERTPPDCKVMGLIPALDPLSSYEIFSYKSVSTLKITK